MIFDITSSLEFLKREAQKHCWELFRPIFDDPRFATCSAAAKPGLHHYGKGGLIYHTAQVVMLCDINNETMGNPIDKRKLFTAAFYHDVGKMWDHVATNDEMTEWTGTTHKRNIHHISRSALTFQKNVDKLTNRPDWLNEEGVDEILHAILAHHGLREWGSPVHPNSKLAYLLHLCDSISARLTDCETIDRVKEKENK